MESWQRQPAAGGRVEKMISNPEKCRPDGGPKPALGGGSEGGKEEAPQTETQRKAMPKHAHTTAQLHSSHTLAK